MKRGIISFRASNGTKYNNLALSPRAYFDIIMPNELNIRDRVMKLVFPHKEHKDFELIGREFTIGSSEDADIQVDAVGVSPIHARIVNDDGVFSVSVDNPACMVSVNGKLVKDTKEVREGDLMIVAQVHCRLEAQQKQTEDDNRTRIRMALPKFVIRGVSGVYFGKTFPLRGKTSIGRHSDNDIFVNVDGISRKHAVISVTANGLEIEDLGSSNGTYVNGEKVTKAEIKVGDEIKLDNIRFLIQSPEMKAPEAPQKQSAKPSLNRGNVSANQATTTKSNAGKWIITIIVLLGAAAGAAWYLGYLDKFLA